jgi:ABC-type polysaccharide/polyol phosphate transport system ATPase subunit/ABC-type polysaccharide/polyol phosphate export permease
MSTPARAPDRPPETATSRVAVAARSVTKSFRLPHESYSTVKERVTHPLRHRTYEQLTVLDDVSFEIRQGEFMGVVGRNGSGKSTLLKCLSHIYRADAGEIVVEGRLAPFVDLGVGFNDEMTAADNAVLNAILLGLDRHEARARLDDIIAFAELERFVDLKLKNFSSGMQVRLAFAVTTQVDAEVLLFDEVLAVGDTGFQRKCLDRLETMRDAGRTVLFVTHDMETVQDVCDRAMLIDAGRLVDIGDPGRIAEAYEERNARTDGGERVDAGRGARTTRRRPPRGRGARPPMFGRDVRRVAAVARALAVAEFRVRYFDSLLSYLWVMAGPLFFFAILYVVFTNVGAFDHGVPHYPLYLLTSLVLWTFFATGTTTAVNCLVRQEGLLRKLPLPHVTIPLAVMLGAAFDLAANLIVVFVFVLAAGIDPSVTWLELPVIVALLALLVTGTALGLSASYVRHRDVDQIWVLLRQALFYGSAIFYVVASLPTDLQRPVMANPLTAAFTQVRHALIDPSAPSAAALSGGAVRLLIPLGIVVLTFVAGVWIFRRESPLVAENL